MLPPWRGRIKGGEHYGSRRKQRKQEENRDAGIRITETGRTAWFNETDGGYVDMISGRKMQTCGVNVPAYRFYYLKRIRAAAAISQEGVS